MAEWGDWRVYCDKCDFEMTFRDGEDEDIFNTRRAANAHRLLHESRNQAHWCNVECLTEQEVSHVSDGGMRLCGELDSEDELQEWLRDYFEDNGWTALREVSPHGSDFSADLLVHHDDFGWIGIETKYFGSAGGAKAAKAHHQITRKYRGRTYVDGRIDKWAICPYFWGMRSPSSFDRRNQQRGRAKFIREFFCRHGIAYIDLDASRCVIDFAYSDRAMKIPVGGDTEKYEKAVDIEKIEEYVDRKRDEYDYQ